MKIMYEENTKVNEKDEDGLTALHWAVIADRLDKVKSLADRGADINSRDIYGQDRSFSLTHRSLRTMLPADEKNNVT